MMKGRNVFICFRFLFFSVNKTWREGSGELWQQYCLVSLRLCSRQLGEQQAEGKRVVTMGSVQEWR